MWYTVGTHGAEFADIPKDAIVFNHIQSKALLENGSIVGRGKALVSGTALLDGSGGNRRPGSSGGSGGDSGSGGESASDTTDPTDWIEILIDRIERAIDRIARVAESAYKNLTTKTNATFEQIDKVTEEIGIQERAANRYLQEANSVGLSDDLAALVRNGSIDITQYDEDTQKKIEDYQNWYEKMLDCQDAAEELHETLAELYEANFENIQQDFENQLELLEHSTNSYETGIDTLEAKGYLDSTSYYKAMQDVERENISILTEELSSLQEAFDTAIASGEIENGSDAWYQMQISINEVKEAIDDATLSMLEYEQTIREIEWGHFDYYNDRIEQLTKESDFLIDLMEFGKLHDEQGALTDTGMASIGLHGLNYNVYMAQADKYAEEYMRIQKQLADDPYNTKLIERRDELLELQQESILAAEEEKEAIRDLVEEGIELELDALDELIGKYSDALDSAKDLYDYQNKISDHTSEISNLQKQLLAYENNTSEEAKAIIQEIKVELEQAEDNLAESEYDQYISDQKKLLDELYIEYELILNQRLDNVDALIEEMIGTVNANSESINETLVQVGDDVGYTMTEGMQSIWDNSVKETISTYGDGFTEKLTTTNEVLDKIRTGLEVIVGEVQREIDIRIAEEKAAQARAEAEQKAREEAAKAAHSYTDNSGGSNGGRGSSGSKSNSSTKESTDYGDIWSRGSNYQGVGAIDSRTDNGYSAAVSTANAATTTTTTSKKATLDEKKYFGFSSGGLVNFTGMAKLHGSEQKPELVLNANDTANFIELKDVLREIASRNISIGQQNYGVNSVPHSVIDTSKIMAAIRNNGRSDLSNNFGDFVLNISIDHVDDYNDFVNQLRNDSKFEKMIEDITLCKITGGSSLQKNRHRW